MIPNASETKPDSENGLHEQRATAAAARGAEQRQECFEWGWNIPAVPAGLFSVFVFLLLFGVFGCSFI